MPAAIVGSPIPIPGDDISDLKARLEQLERREQERSATVQSPAASSPLVSPLAFTNTTTCCPQEAGTDNSRPAVKGSWWNGLTFQSDDGDFRVHVGGQIQADFGWVSANQTVQFGPGGTGQFDDGALLRRAAFLANGLMYRNVEWVLQVDFTGNFNNDNGIETETVGTVRFNKAYVNFTELPVIGNLQVGYFDEPFGFSHLVSSRWLNFMERQPGNPAFVSLGAMAWNWTSDERGTWALGLFHPTDNDFGFATGDGEMGVTGRLTYLPVYQDCGRELVHVGVAASGRHVPEDEARLRGRPDVRTAPSSRQPSLADTGTFQAETQEALGAELAGVLGPWTLQSEYYCTWLHDTVFPNMPPPAGIPRGTLFYQGAYVELLYFLTGEHQPYDRKEGLFTRVVPLNNFSLSGPNCGWGAWQVGVRYTYLDLQNKNVNGATLNDVALGVNWILNPHTRTVWNLGIDHRDSTPEGSDGWSYFFGVRVAVDF